MPPITEAEVSRLFLSLNVQKTSLGVSYKQNGVTWKIRITQDAKDHMNVSAFSTPLQGKMRKTPIQQNFIEFNIFLFSCSLQTYI